MKTRLEIIQSSISFIEALSNMIDLTNHYNVGNIYNLLVSADNEYLKTLVEFFEGRKNWDIDGTHLHQILQLALEGKKELLEITGDL